MKSVILQYTTLAVLSLLLISVAKIYAPRLNLVDRPTGRKQHVGVIPTVGGLSIYPAFLVGMMLQIDLAEAYRVLLAGMGFLAIIGGLDDAFDLSATKKLVAQLVAATLIIVASNLAPFSAGDIAASAQIAMLIGIGLTLFLVLWIINAVNMIDGFDGLAGGLVVVALAWLGLGSVLTGPNDMATVILRLVVPVIAFLAFNHRAPWRKRASVFMGDAGTMMLGFAIAWFCLELHGQGVPMVACTLVVAIPLIDTASLFFRRVYAGKSPFKADRQHLHHLLEAAGVPAAQVVMLINVATAIFGGVGILGAYGGLTPAVFVVVWLLIAIAHTLLIGFLLHRSDSNAMIPSAVRARAGASGHGAHLK